jgi:hypothetical protein
MLDPHVSIPPLTVDRALIDWPSPRLSPILSLLAENKAKHLERDIVNIPLDNAKIANM